MAQLAGLFSCRGRFPSLYLMEKNALEGAVSDMEIRNALFGMAPFEVLGVNGYHAKFYQLHWDVIVPSVYSMVHRVLEGQLMNPSLNQTFLVLIPKVIGPKRIT